MKKRLSNRGFTLPEILVASLITIILLGAVGSVFLTAMNLFSRGEAIAYKQGSITNVETNLQNKLAIASEVKIASSPAGPYSIGFNTEGVCQEVIGEVKDGVNQLKYYPIDQVSEIILTYKGNMLRYKLVPKDVSMTVLEGGIILNNIGDISSKEGFEGYLEVGQEESREIFLNEEKPRYLLIEPAGNK